MCVGVDTTVLGLSIWCGNFFLQFLPLLFDLFFNLDFKLTVI